MTVNELNSRCVEIHTGLEMEIHDAQKDIDFLKEENIKLHGVFDTIHALTSSVDKLALRMEDTLSEIKRQGSRISALENKPAKRWESIVEKAITVAVGAILGYIFSHIGFK